MDLHNFSWNFYLRNVNYWLRFPLKEENPAVVQFEFLKEFCVAELVLINTSVYKHFTHKSGV